MPSDLNGWLSAVLDFEVELRVGEWRCSEVQYMDSANSGVMVSGLFEGK